MIHDPLCDWYGAFYPEGVDPADCPDCARFARVRADERERCSQQLAKVESQVRDLANAAHEATIEFALAGEREQIARAIEALRYPEAVFAYEVKQDAAQIARNGGQ